MTRPLALLAFVLPLLLAACGPETAPQGSAGNEGALLGKGDQARMVSSSRWLQLKLLAVANGLAVGTPTAQTRELAELEIGLTTAAWTALSEHKEALTSAEAVRGVIGQHATAAIARYARDRVGVREYWGWLTRIATGDGHRASGVRVWGQAAEIHQLRLSAQAGDELALRLVRFCGGGWNPRIDLHAGELKLAVNPWGISDVEIPKQAFAAGTPSAGVRVDTEQVEILLRNRNSEAGYFLFELHCVGGPCLGQASTLDRWAFLFEEASLRALTCEGQPPPVSSEADDAACSDGIDNDGDGFVDCDDYDCSRNPAVSVCGPQPTPENTDTACSDGIDNDGDGYVDCNDYDCSRNPAVSVCGPQPTPENTDTACSDGIDNDGDGLVDCDDSECANAPLCAPSLVAKLQVQRRANARALSYLNARLLLFSTLDNRDGTVTGVYTNEGVATAGIPDDSVMNTEHTWPQSWALGVDAGFYTDLHHLFPTMAWINRQRSALPFCEVAAIQGSHLGGSRWGWGPEGQHCFEPRDAHKGNAARAMFYVSAVYGMPMDDTMERVLRRWNAADPPDAAEQARNRAIREAQGNENPFVTSPEMVEQISDF